MKPPVTIVIPNYNGARLLRLNLPSVINAAQTYGADTHIIVVDDGSKDESVDVLKQEFSNVVLVQHALNQGFAEAVHSGVDAAKTELILLLNSDVVVQENLIAGLVAYFEDPDAFSVNPLIYDESGEVKRHSWNLRQFSGGSLKILKWDLAKAQAKRNSGQKLAALYAHGGSMMLRKSMFKALDGFHPIYKPFYSEDFDLGIRAWRKGWKSYFEPNVSIVHQSLGSIRQTVKMKHIKCIRRRNRYLLEWVHLTPKQLLLSALPMTVIQLFGELLSFDFNNLKGFYLALLKLPQAILARQEVALADKLSFEQVLALIGDSAD